jgi:hypothetical protein
LGKKANRKAVGKRVTEQVSYRFLNIADFEITSLIAFKPEG